MWPTVVKIKSFVHSSAAASGTYIALCSFDVTFPLSDLFIPLHADASHNCVSIHNSPKNI